jgi:hypothetical protein
MARRAVMWNWPSSGCSRNLQSVVGAAPYSPMPCSGPGRNRQSACGCIRVRLITPAPCQTTKREDFGCTARSLTLKKYQPNRLGRGWVRRRATLRGLSQVCSGSLHQRYSRPKLALGRDRHRKIYVRSITDLSLLERIRLNARVTLLKVGRQAKGRRWPFIGQRVVRHFDFMIWPDVVDVKMGNLPLAKVAGKVAV